MRKYTLLISVIVHLAAAAAVFMAPLFAVAALPSMRSQTSWVSVRAPDLPEAPRSSRRKPTLSPSRSIPIDPPVGVQPGTDSASPGNTPPAYDDGPVGNGPVPDGVIGLQASGIEPPPPVTPAPAAPQEPVRPGGNVERPRKIVDVAPVYPPFPLAARIEGRVTLEAVLAEDGTVRDVRVLRSAPLFDQAAVDAVRKWRFTSTRLNGVPVPVILTVTVEFTLR